MPKQTVFFNVKSRKAATWLPSSLLFVLLLNPNLAHCSEIVWGYFNYPPVIYFDKNEQKAKGIAVDIVAQVQKKTNIRFRLKHYPLPRLIEAIENGQPIVLSSPKWPSLNDLGRFSSQPIFTAKTIILASQILPKTLRGLQGKLGIIRGYNYSGSLLELQKNNPLLQTTLRNSHLSLIKSLMAKRIDYALDYSAPAEQAAIDANFTEVQRRVIHQLPVYFYESKNIDKNLDLTAKINALIPTLRYQKSSWADSQGLLQERE